MCCVISCTVISKSKSPSNNGSISVSIPSTSDALFIISFVLLNIFILLSAISSKFILVSDVFCAMSDAFFVISFVLLNIFILLSAISAKLIPISYVFCVMYDAFCAMSEAFEAMFIIFVSMSSVLSMKSSISSF